MAQLACSVNTLLASTATAAPWGPAQQQVSCAGVCCSLVVHAARRHRPPSRPNFTCVTPKRLFQHPWPARLAAAILLHPAVISSHATNTNPQRSSYTSLGLGLGLGLGPVAAAGSGALLPPSFLSQSQIGSEASDLFSGPLPCSDRAAALAAAAPPSGGSGGSGGWSGGGSRPSKVANAGGLGPPAAAHALHNHALFSGQGHGQGQAQAQRRSATTLEAGLPPLMARGRGAY